MSAPTPVLGLTGHAGAGKDSCAAVLVAGGWGSIAFADALRIEVAAAFRVDIQLLSARHSKEQPQRGLAAGAGENANWLRFVAVNGYSLIEPRSARWVLQRWGEFRRQSDPNHWVRPVVQWTRFERTRGRYAGLVVTDVRFANEALALRGLGANLLRVHRPEAAAMAPDTASHESERHTTISVDGDIHNAGSLAELGAEVWRVLQALPQARGTS